MSLTAQDHSAEVEGIYGFSRETPEIRGGPRAYAGYNSTRLVLIQSLLSAIRFPDDITIKRELVYTPSI
jgi:hypothetical protein